MLGLTNMLDKLAQGPLRARRHRCIYRRATRGLSELRGLVHQCLPVPVQRQLDHRPQPLISC